MFRFYKFYFKKQILLFIDFLKLFLYFQIKVESLKNDFKKNDEFFMLID